MVNDSVCRMDISEYKGKYIIQIDGIGSVIYNDQKSDSFYGTYWIKVGA